jgi:hypothetical protein
VTHVPGASSGFPPPLLPCTEQWLQLALIKHNLLRELYAVSFRKTAFAIGLPHHNIPRCFFIPVRNALPPLRSMPEVVA